MGLVFRRVSRDTRTPQLSSSHTTRLTASVALVVALLSASSSLLASSVSSAADVAHGITSGALQATAIVSPGAHWYALNDSNQVAGFAYTGSTVQSPAKAVRWDNGVTTSLTSDAPNAGAFAIDSAGVAFGGVGGGGATGYPAMWSPAGTLTKLTAAGGALNALSDGVHSASDNGNVVGLMSNATTHNVGAWFYALAPAYAVVPLGVDAGSGMVAINNSGAIAVGNTTAPYLQVNGAKRSLKVAITTGFDLNDSGDVAGAVVPTPTSGAAAAIELANGVVEDLPPLHPGDSVTVNAINNNDEAVGYDDSSQGIETAVAWINGKVVSVASLVSGSFSTPLDQALDVNSNGSILAESSSGYYLLEAGGTLSVSLAGEKSTAPDTVLVTMTLTNSGTSDITGLNFTDPKGLENDGVALKNGNIGPTQSGLTLIGGPTPALPTTLAANGPPVVIHYTYSTTTSGDAVLVANATGTDGDGKTVHSKSAITVYVTNPPATVGDYQKLVTSALLAADSITSQAQNTVANTEANGLATALKLPPATPGQEAAAIQLGLPPQMGILMGTVKSSDLEQWFDTFSTTLATDVKGGISYLGETGKELAREELLLENDPATQAVVLGRLVDGVEALPESTRAALVSQKDKLGYIGALLALNLAPVGPLPGLINTGVEGAAALKSLDNNLTLAADGFTASKVADVNAYNNNRTAYLNANATYYANEFYELGKTEVVTLLGGGLEKALGAAGGAVAADAKAIDASVAASVQSSTPVAADSYAAAIEQSNVATSQFQTLPIGTPLPVDQAADIGGLIPGDQAGVQTAISNTEKKFPGVKLEIGVRTSEPLSAAIVGGSPKLTFMKPKAVSSMDITMGAPSEIAAYTAPGDVPSGQVFNGGVVTIFKPVPQAEDVLAAINEVNPAYVSQYRARFASQEGFYNDWQNPNSPLRVLVQGSADSPLVAGSAVNRQGVTAIASYPGFAVPAIPADALPGAQPLIYLQQLDQEAFYTKWGLTKDEAQAIKTSLEDSPGAKQINYIARPNPDGSVSFFDGLNNNEPILSDCDIQNIGMVDGAPWPKGIDPSQVQAEFKVQLEQNVSRLPNHGASGTASDLPSSYIEAADKFIMNTSDPAFAQAVADNLATRYASQSAIFTSNAAGLEAKAALAYQAGDKATAKALFNLASIYRQTAAKFAKVDAAYLLAKYPPGEKIIVIKLGDVRVGYGPKPKT